MTRALFATALLLALAACGRQGPLRHPQGVPPVPTATGATRPATPDELMTPSTQSRPQRNVDILSKSDRRPLDPFDKPPGPDNGRGGHED
jgi:predicted small lipoprotein YifL